MIKLLIASHNQGKVIELMEIFKELETQLCTPNELGLKTEVTESGKTYAENAYLKAIAYAASSGLIAIGDDSGLEVEALDGAPGLYSARYAGPGASDAARRARLMQALRHTPAPRTARFRCALVVAQPNGQAKVFEGECHGEIILEERGTNGFGYDPIFYLPEYGHTMAELPSALKNQISHRARAAQAALPYLKQLIKTPNEF